MSNLSELLPTGGGQNAVDFVATGTLASGQTVALKADGTVEAVAGATEGVGTAAVFETANTLFIGSAFDSNAGKVVIAYRDVGNSGAATAVVGTVSGTSISFGTPVAFASIGARFRATFDFTSNKIIIVYINNTNSGYAIVGTVSGTSISFGTALTISTNCDYPTVAFDSTNNKLVIAYRDAGNSGYATAVVGTVSGTSISLGTPAVFEAASSYYTFAIFDPTNNKVVISYIDGGNSNYGTAVVGTVSGTSISFGTPVVFESAMIENNSMAFDSTNNKVVIAYRDTGNTNAGTAVVGTVSGTSISFGTAVVFESNQIVYTGTAFDSNAGKVVIAYRDQGNSYGTVIVGTVSGTSISFGAAAVFEAASTTYIAATYDSTNNKVVIAYTDDGNSGYGTGIVFTVGSTNLSATTFLGITSEAISSGATGAINTYGGINTVQTGLTIASDYYVQDDGSLSTTTSTVKAGQAISATTINMMDLT